MGDSEEYTQGQPAEDGLPADPREPLEEPIPQHDFDATDPIAAIQQQLLMEEADEVAPPSGIERTEVGPDVESAPEAPHEDPIEPLADGSAPPEASEPEEPGDEPLEPGNEPADESADEPTMEPAEEPMTDDDLAAAVAAANESVGDAEIIPPAGAAEAATDPAAVPAPAAVFTPAPTDLELPAARYGAPWWPYFIYTLLWVALAGVGVWQFQQLPAGQPVYEAMSYRWFLFAGLVLSAMGPVLVLGVWLTCRESEKRQRKGLFTSALLKGAFFTLLGVMVWWGTLLAVDFMRFGRLL